MAKKTNKEIVLQYWNDNALQFLELVTTSTQAKIEFDSIFINNVWHDVINFKIMIGFYDGKRKSPFNAAYKIGTSSERMEQIYAKFIKKMCDSPYKYKIEEFLERSYE